MGGPHEAPRAPFPGPLAGDAVTGCLAGLLGGPEEVSLSNSGAPCFEDLKTGTSKQGPQNSWVLVYHHPLFPAQLQENAGNRAIRPTHRAKGAALPSLRYW